MGRKVFYLTHRLLELSRGFDYENEKFDSKLNQKKISKTGNGSIAI